jgi:hypothetical protein
MDKELLITILELIAKYGLTAVISILKMFNKEEITQADILALNELVKDPEFYIPKGE